MAQAKRKPRADDTTASGGKTERSAGDGGGAGPGAMLRTIPQVDRLLGDETFLPLIEAYSRPVVIRQVREDLDALRRRAAEGLNAGDLSPAAIRDRVARGLAVNAIPYYRRVINATGVVLHTGLGRAPLPPLAVDALAALAGHPVRVEIDLESGERGGRDEGCAALLRQLTGAEAGTVVNNNAGATLLVLAALARGKKVILSRGEMVEIGGSYRVPEIMQEGGARLVEVGTTNRTHAKDYRKAVDPETGMILKVHTSNYRIEGFTNEVEIEELVGIGREAGVPVVHDLGSGCLLNLAHHGFPEEPHVLRSIAAGADLVCFSGDKLLGGPQAGIIIGKKWAVERCVEHPLYRALRPGRLIYVAMEATLRIYLQGEGAITERIPAIERLIVPPERLKQRARKLLRRLDGIVGLECEVVAENSQAGSGSLPARDLPTWAVRVVARGASSAQLAARLRGGDPAVLGRIRDDGVILDVRTIADDELPLIEARFRALPDAG